MENEEDLPKFGIDIQKWSDLDNLLPKLDLDIELFLRRNMAIASLVILSGLLKGNQQQRQEYLVVLTSRYFTPRLLPRFLFEKIAEYLQKNDTVPETLLERWITEYHAEIWGESPPEPKMFYGNNFTLRQILNFNPTEGQVFQAIKLRKLIMDERGY